MQHDITKIDAYVSSHIGPSTPVYFIKRTKSEIHAVRTGYNPGTAWNHGENGQPKTAVPIVFTCRRSIYDTRESWVEKGDSGFRAHGLIFDVEAETKRIAEYHAKRERASEGIKLAQEITQGLRWFANANLSYHISAAHVAWLKQIAELVKQCPKED
jgi:hypothetical protein